MNVSGRPDTPTAYNKRVVFSDCFGITVSTSGILFNARLKWSLLGLRYWDFDFAFFIKVGCDLSDCAQLLQLHLLDDKGIWWDSLFCFEFKLQNLNDNLSQSYVISFFDLMGFWVILFNNFEQGLIGSFLAVQ